MATRFLLDQHIPPSVAEILRKRGKVQAKAVCGSELEHGDDPDLLRVAAREGWVFVTYDTEFSRHHLEVAREGAVVPGLIYVSALTIPTSEPAALAAALEKLAGRIDRGEVDASGGVFLQR